MRNAYLPLPFLVLVACNGSGGQDAQYEDVQDAGCAPFCSDVPARDGSIPPDVTTTEGGLDGSSTEGGTDGAVNPDGTVGDGGSPPGDGGFSGPCTTVGTLQKVANETRMLQRQVFLQPFGAGYTAGNFAQVAGLDNVYLTPVNLDGTLGTPSNITNNSFDTITGGAFAVDGTGHLVAYSSNDSGNLDVYLRRTDATDTPMATTFRVSNDAATSEDPQIVALTTGWIVVWRSRTTSSTGGVAQLMSAFVDASHTVSAPVAVTGTGVVAGAFALVADGSRAAVVYVAEMTTTAVAMAQPLSTTGVPTGAAITLSTASSSGTSLVDSLGAVLRGTDLVTVMGVQPMGTLTVQRVDLATLAPGSAHGLTALGSTISTPGIALDGTTGFAVSYRAALAGGGVVAMVRLDSTLAPREAASEVTPQSYTGDAVRLATRGDGTYVVGWSDSTPSHTVANVQVMQCP